MIDVSKQLKELRKNHGYTIQTVCTGADIPIRTYQNYEYGKREISAEAIMKLCTFYGVSADYILGRESPIEIDIDIVELVSKVADFSELERNFFELYISIDSKKRSEFLSHIARSIKDSIEQNKHDSSAG